MPHFGVALSVDDFHGFADRLKKAGIKFIIEPHLRFEGQPGEQVKVTQLCVLVVAWQCCHSHGWGCCRCYW